MNLEEALFWWEERSPWVRRSVLGALALAVYGGGSLAAVQPQRAAAEDAAERVRRLRSELAERRERLESFTPAETDLEEEIVRARSLLWPDSALRGADFRSALLTALSRAAEGAGVSSPIFNPAGVDTLVSDGPGGGGLLAVAVDGEFDAETRAVARFLERLRTVPARAFLDTLSIRRALPEHRVELRLRVLRPEGRPPAGEDTAAARGGRDRARGGGRSRAPTEEAEAGDRSRGGAGGA